MSAFCPYLSLPYAKQHASKKTGVYKRFHEQLNTRINHSDTDSVSERLSTADSAENQIICGRGNLAVSSI